MFHGTKPGDYRDENLRLIQDQISIVNKQEEDDFVLLSDEEYERIIKRLYKNRYAGFALMFGIMVVWLIGSGLFWYVSRPLGFSFLAFFGLFAVWVWGECIYAIKEMSCLIGRDLLVQEVDRKVREVRDGFAKSR